MLTPRGSAGLGFSLPAAIGAAFACPNRSVVILAGDGGFSYSLGELATAIRYGLNITCIIFNNSSYSWIEHWHQIYFEGATGEPSRLNQIDFAAVAQGFRCDAVRIDQPTELESALTKCLRTPGPAVVDVIVSGEESPLPSYVDTIKERGAVR